MAWFEIILDLFVVGGVNCDIIRSVLMMKRRMCFEKTTVVFTLYTMVLMFGVAYTMVGLFLFLPSIRIYFKFVHCLFVIVGRDDYGEGGGITFPMIELTCGNFYSF